MRRRYREESITVRTDAERVYAGVLAVYGMSNDNVASLNFALYAVC